MFTRAAVAIEPPSKTACAAALRWRAASQTLFGRPLAAWQAETRAALGLPTDRPVVVTGHQAQFWHAGILAKWFVADACGVDLKGCAAQLVVDQDTNDPGVIEYPAEANGRLVVARLPVLPARRGGPTALQPTFTALAPGVPPLPEAVDGLERIATALRTTSHAASAAAQVAMANDALLGSLVQPLRTVLATKLLTTPIGEAFLDALRRDGPACAAAYNAALASDPHLARPLAAGELPLWRLADGSRERVTAATLGAGGLLAPRAFLMTALVRLAVGDLFVHGTGGGRYERVTEAWMRQWLGVELAPMVVATATLRLPLERFVGSQPVATASDLRRLEWDPDAAGAAGPSPGKRAWLEQIAAAPRGSVGRRAAYRGWRQHLAERLDAHRGEVEIVRSLVANSRERAAASLVARSRTWPWPLHTPRAVIELRDVVLQTLES